MVDVAVLSQFNGIPVTELEDNFRIALEGIGFKLAGERMIRGGVVDPQPREIAERALFHRHHLHQNSRLENEIDALGSVREVRDDFGLRGRAEVYRVSLKNMASAHQLHQGINLRGHQVWASYDHFSTLLAIRGEEPNEELLDILDFFNNSNNSCRDFFFTTLFFLKRQQKKFLQNF